IFPFARRVLADAIRDGGFPPLLLEPLDFASVFLQQQEAAEGGIGETLGTAYGPCQPPISQSGCGGCFCEASAMNLVKSLGS
ncbi:protein-export chaperone SecB, partial [Acinetobacter baumannii]